MDRKTFGVDVVGCPGSTHEYVRLGLSYIIHFSSPVTIFHKKFFLRCLASNEMQMLSRRPMLFSESSYGTHFPLLSSYAIVSKLLFDQLPTVQRVPF
uniref:Ovule protein n=1 Tax=Heterorhabditis bacteriophora TaxID=37862 RepID=A0A1I7WI37_HETBA